MRAIFAFCVAVLVSAAKAEDAKRPLPSSCAAILCEVGSACVEEVDQNGVVTARCGPPRPTCANVRCGFAQRCVLRKVICVRAPCYPQPVCIPINAGERPGICPAPSGLAGICRFDPTVNCVEDEECFPGQKCCSEGCGRVCKVPVQNEVKPGQCPTPGPRRPGICANTCRSDSDCKGSDKCCRTGCGGYTCQGAVMVEPQPPSCAHVKCRGGEVCVISQVFCIRAPCPPGFPTCVPLNKPGRCPRTLYGSANPSCTGKTCQQDPECPGDQKCCKTPCGNRCQNPDQLFTCATVDCQPDFICVMKEQCDRDGCFPRPVCERIKRCPLFPAWVPPNCVPRDTCSDLGPNGCPTGKLCCRTDCGRHCVTAV